jgi:hypothetical protein
MFERNGIHILIEDQAQRNDKVEYVESLRTNLIWQNFDSVGDDEGREGDIIKGIVEEDESDDGISRCFVLVDSVLS